MLGILKNFAKENKNNAIYFEKQLSSYCLYQKNQILLNNSNSFSDLNESQHLISDIQQNQKIDITQHLAEFTKFIIQFIGNLKKFDLKQEIIEKDLNQFGINYPYGQKYYEEEITKNIIYKLQNNYEGYQKQIREESSFEQIQGSNMKHYQDQQNQLDQQQIPQINHPDETTLKNGFQNLKQLIENYEELILKIICGQENFVIQFQNPITLELYKLNEYYLQELYTELIYSECPFCQYSQNSKDENQSHLIMLQKYIQDQCIQLKIKYLQINSYFQTVCFHNMSSCCKCSERSTRHDFLMKDIQFFLESEYIYILLEIVDSFNIEYVIKIIPNLYFSGINVRSKIIVKSFIHEPNSQEECNIYNLSLNLQSEQQLEIASLQEGSRCFLIFQDQNLMQLNKEHFIEDQILLLIVLFEKTEIIDLFYNNFQSILVDMLID